MSAPKHSVEPLAFGDARVYLGDCRDVLPLLEPGSVRLLWTDPPYGNKNGDGDLAQSRAASGIPGAAVTAPEPISNDSPETMRAAVSGMLRAAAPVLANDCCCCCCCCCGGGGPQPTFAWMANELDKPPYEFFHETVWDKAAFGLGWKYRRDHEFVMVAKKRGAKLAWAAGAKSISNIIRIPKPKTFNHPNEKPLELVSLFIRQHTDPGDLVLDPFMGSGTTGVAALRLGRRFIGIELEPKWFDAACKRLGAETAQSRLDI